MGRCLEPCSSSCCWAAPAAAVVLLVAEHLRAEGVPVEFADLLHVAQDGGALEAVVEVEAAALVGVADDLGVVVGPFRPEDGDARITRAAYVVGEDLGAGRIEDNRAD